MIRSGFICLSAGVALSIAALSCGSSSSESGAGGSGGGSTASSSGAAGSGGGTGTSSPSGAWDMARIGNPGTGWWMNAVKGKFFLSIKLKNSYSDDVAGRSETVAITKLVAGKSATGALKMVPATSELPGKWANDPDSGYTADGPVVATTFEKATEFIDGGADPFYDASKSYKASAFAWAYYLEDDATKASPYALDLRVWEMASAADAKTLFTDLLNNSLYSPNNVPWTECKGDACP